MSNQFTVHTLAKNYVDDRCTLIAEFDGDFHRGYTQLWAEVVNDINPLLVKYGFPPLRRDEVALSRYFEDEES
jgi:hypothetical protein